MPLGIPLEMRVVIDVANRWIELVDRGAAGPAREQPRDGPVLDRQNWCRARRHDIDGLGVFPNMPDPKRPSDGSPIVHRYQLRP